MTTWRLHTATLFYSLLASLSDIDLFLDIGSLDGREAFSVEARFPNVRCIAFEPNPRNIDVIRNETRRRSSRISLETFAVGNENGTASFYTRTPVGSNNHGTSSVLKLIDEPLDGEFATEAIEVPLRRLDSIIAASEFTTAALWIDVEGAGYQVLEGIEGIAQRVQIVHIEVETRPLFHGARLAPDVMQIMSSYGFDLLGSNLDRNLHRPQGDLVFLRRHVLKETVTGRAKRNAWIIEHLAMQRLIQKVVPPQLYRAGRDWFIQSICR